MDWSESVIEELFHPIPMETFLRSYWGRKALFIPGDGIKARKVFSLARFLAALKRCSGEGQVSAIFSRRGGGGKQRRVNLKPGQAKRAYADGATICVNWLDTADAGLDRLCAETRSALGYVGDIRANAYWSPNGAGLKAHFDAKVVTVVQIEGSKIWRFAQRPLVPWPMSNATLKSGALVYSNCRPSAWEIGSESGALESWKEVTLTAGDVLCLPAGTLHEAQAIGSSLALNLHFNPLDVGALVGRLLSDTLSDRPHWRHLPPLLGRQGRYGGADKASEREIASRLSDAQEMIAQWQRDPGRLLTRVLAFVNDRQDGASVRNGRVRGQGAARLRVSPVLIIASSKAARRIIGFVGTERIEIGGVSMRILKRILASGEISADGFSVAGVTRHTVRLNLQRFRELGILDPA